MNVFGSFDLHKFSKKMKSMVAVMAMMVIAIPFYGQSWNLVTSASDLAVGDSVIIVSGNYALGTTQGNNNRAGVSITNNGDDVEFEEGTAVQGITLVEGTVANSFGFYTGSGYLYASSSSSNQLKTKDDLDDNGSWRVTISNGTTTVLAQGENTRNNMRHNPNNGSPIFACYAANSTTGQPVSIYKYEEGGASTPAVSVTQSMTVFSYNLNNGPSAPQSFSISGSNLTDDVIVSVADDSNFELCASEDGTYSASVTIAQSEGAVAATDVYVRMKAGLDMNNYNATITVASTDATSKTITVRGYVLDPDVDYYVRVNAVPDNDNWAGEYLITYLPENDVLALSGQGFTTGATPSSYGTSTSVSEYYIGGKIVSNTTTDAIKVTVAVTDGGYSIYFDGLGYLGWNTGNSLDFDENVTAGQNEWTLSVSGEIVSINNVADATRRLQYNSSASRFACYTTNQKAITLFKSTRAVQETVAEPTFSPEPGTYNTASVTVSLTCTTEGATIYYNIEPNDAEIAYTAPLTFTETTTINAYAKKNDIRSATVSATYTITDMETVATPVINPDGGTFEDTQEVTITCETADALIYYTLNGNEPTAESLLYSAPIVLDSTTTVKAIAMKENMLPSEIVSATFTKDEPVVAVNYTRITSLSQLQDGDKVIIAARYDDDTSHYYVVPTRIANDRFNGVAVTSENDIISTAVDTVVWTLSIEGDNYRFVNASDASLGWSSGTSFSSSSNFDWNITVYTIPEADTILGNYTGFKITNVATLGESNIRCIAFRHYTNNAGTPFNVFGAYVSNNNVNNGYNYALDLFVDLDDHAPLVATPTFSLPAGNYSSVQTVEISCATEDATIHYTLDSSDPTEDSPVYGTALTISEPTTVKAKAFKQDCIASGIAEAFYNVNTTPTIIVDAETLNFANANEAKTLNVSSLNLTTDITVTVTDNFTVDAETITMNTDAVLTVTFVGDAVTNGTLTLTSGETVVEVALVANPPVASEGCYYPVAEALTDWTGDYLITFSNIPNDTIFVLTEIHQNNYGLYANIFQYYADGVIASNLTTEMCKVTIAETEHGYSMYLYSSGYLGINSDANKLYAYSEFSENRDEWTISESNGEIIITSVKYPNRNLKWNSTTPRFACYNSTSTTGDPLTLYKLGAIPAVASPVFTPAAGYYEEAQNVTITCSTEGATIYYTLDGTEPTNASTQYTEAIPVSQNTTIKAIAYNGDESSFVATARYTFPHFVDNIAALYALENTNENYILTGDVTFVFRNDRNMYVKDATGGLLIYDSGNKITTEYNEGDVISGGIAGTINMFNGLLEFVPSRNTAESTNNTGTVTPIDITVEQLRTNNYVSQLVKLENVYVENGNTYTEGSAGSNTTFTQNGFQALLRNNFKTLDMTIGDGTTWNIIGFASVNSGNFQIIPRGNDDVMIVTSVDELAAEIAIYPNPTSDIVNIVTNGNAQRVEIANVEGQIVSSEAVASDVISISLEAQPAGMYFVRIYTANEVIVRKVTKF